MGVDFIIGDVTTLQADAVVNVINYELKDGGFVNHAIHRVAGPELKEYSETIGACAVGGAKLTPGFNLPAGYIIHTVAPLWRDGNEQEEKWLAACYLNSLELATKYNCRVLYVWDLRYNAASERAAAMFNTVAEYVNTHHQLEEETIRTLRLVEGVIPYLPEKAEYPREIMMPGGATLTVFPQGANVRYSLRYVLPKETDLPDKEEFVPEDPFTKKLLRYIDAKNMTAPMVYSEAGYDRKLFSKIQSDPEYHPRKYTVVRFALALKLNLEETEDLLNAAGFALSRSMIVDIVIKYCILNDMRSVEEVNNILESWGLETI